MILYFLKFYEFSIIYLIIIGLAVELIKSIESRTSRLTDSTISPFIRAIYMILQYCTTSSLKNL